MIEMNYTERLKERLILDSGKYNGYNYWIISYGTHPCAYVEIPKNHLFFGKCDDDAYDLPIDVHGGITYGNYGLYQVVDDSKFIIGWDYCHCYDYSTISCLSSESLKKWTTEEILDDVKSVIKQLKNVKLKGDK